MGGEALLLDLQSLTIGGSVDATDKGDCPDAVLMLENTVPSIGKQELMKLFPGFSGRAMA